MTVAELIEKLKQHDETMEVWCECECHGCADPLTNIHTAEVGPRKGTLTTALFLKAEH